MVKSGNLNTPRLNSGSFRQTEDEKGQPINKEKVREKSGCSTLNLTFSILFFVYVALQMLWA